MDLKKISVEKLFGLLNYTIVLENSDTIIITGPNGYGKTMLLKIIYNILNHNIEFFFSLQFEQISLDFNRSHIKLDKQKNKSISVTVTDQYNTKSHKSFTPHKKRKENDNFFEKIYSDCIDDNEKKMLLARIAYDEFIRHDRFNKFESINDKQSQNQFLAEGIPSSNVTFIKAQRIENIKTDKPAIEEQALYLLELIKKASASSAQISQRLDSTFPTRLFESIDENISISSINDRLIGIQKKRETYMNFGLIKSEDTFIPEKFSNTILGKEYSTVLHLYISDALDKLSPYEELFDKINLFVGLLNEKMLAFKKIKISDELGFYFVSDTGGRISLTDLSSGEQNQIVIYFDLIFKSKRNSIIMIDEPEISLHVAWQKEFLDSIARIQKLNDFSKVIIATHSPQIINNNWEITYDLFENNIGK